MPWLRHMGVDLLAAYITLSIVAGYGFDKETGTPSRTWTVIGLVAAALVVVVLERQFRRQDPPREHGDR